jgi:hypothetical protein
MWGESAAKREERADPTRRIDGAMGDAAAVGFGWGSSRAYCGMSNSKQTFFPTLFHSLNPH